MYEIILGRSQSDQKKYGKRGTVLIGKQYVQMGQTSSLSNPIYLDVARAHAMLICGKRGGGKCLTGDSKILLSDKSEQTIKEIYEKFSKNSIKVSQIDDYFKINKELYVKSFDINKEIFTDKKVTHVFRRKIKEELVEYFYENISNKNKSLLTTADHKILSYVNLNDEYRYYWKSFKDKEIIFGNLISFDNNAQKFASIELKKQEIRKFEGYVYDLTVEETHNFVANDIVVHNSYTMGSIAEGLADMDPEIAKNLSFVLLDTMGVYWSMKYPNKKEEHLLKKWGLEEKGLDVQIYVPGGFFNQYKEDGVPADFPFYIQPKELLVEDWLHAFRLHIDDPIGVGLQRVIGRAMQMIKDFSIDDLMKLTEEDTRLDEKTKLAIINRLDTSKTWGIFSKNATPIRDILIGGKVTVIDLSAYVALPGGWEVKALVLGILSKKIFIERMMTRKKEELFDIVNTTQLVKQKDIKDDMPMPWLIVDEAHEFLPRDEIVPSSQALITILREGRQPGVSLILATQQPGKIHTDAITQSDIVLSHRITASFDLEALDKIFLSYDSKGSKNLFNSMPRVKGCAIIMDDKNERLHTMQVKPRITWHGGEDPNAIRNIKDDFDLD